ncbi:MAG: hypothetical protein ACO4AU_04235 [bacterium]
MVHSLEPEYQGKVRFIIAGLNTPEGRAFAQLHDVSNVTLLFFSPEGQRIATLTGPQEPDYLRRAFNRAFKLN